MRLSDLMSRLDLAVWPQMALVLFVGVFVLIAWRAARTPGGELKAYAALPLEDETAK